MLISSYENPKIATHYWTAIDRRMLEPTTKISHIQGKRRSPKETIGGVKLHLESNSIPARDAQRAQTKPCVHQDPETPENLSQTCLWVFVSCGGMGQQWPNMGSGALAAADLDHAHIAGRFFTNWGAREALSTHLFPYTSLPAVPNCLKWSMDHALRYLCFCTHFFLYPELLSC